MQWLSLLPTERRWFTTSAYAVPCQTISVLTFSASPERSPARLHRVIPSAPSRPGLLAAGARHCSSLFAMLRTQRAQTKSTDKDPRGPSLLRRLRSALGRGRGARVAGPPGRWLLPWLRKAGGAQWAVCGSAERTSHFAYGKQCDIFCCAFTGE